MQPLLSLLFSIFFASFPITTSSPSQSPPPSPPRHPFILGAVIKDVHEFNGLINVIEQYQKQPEHTPHLIKRIIVFHSDFNIMEQASKKQVSVDQAQTENKNRSFFQQQHKDHPISITLILTEHNLSTPNIGDINKGVLPGVDKAKFDDFVVIVPKLKPTLMPKLGDGGVNDATKKQIVAFFEKHERDVELLFTSTDLNEYISFDQENDVQERKEFPLIQLCAMARYIHFYSVSTPAGLEKALEFVGIDNASKLVIDFQLGDHGHYNTDMIVALEDNAKKEQDAIGGASLPFSTKGTQPLYPFLITNKIFHRLLLVGNDEE